MRNPLFCLLLPGPLASRAQASASDTIPLMLIVLAAPVPALTRLPVRTDAVRKFMEIKGTTKLLTDELGAFKTCPQVDRILAESVDDFAQIATGTPIEEAYFQALGDSLMLLTPLPRAR